MQYLSKGLAEDGKPGFGKFLAVFFAILCIGGSLGGGNSFQVNQSMNAIQETVPALATAPWAYGLVMTFLVGIVIVGGIRRIANVAEKIVPTMVVIYVAGAIVVILEQPGVGPRCAGVDLPAGDLARRRLRRLHRRARRGLPARGVLQRGGRRLGCDRALGGQVGVPRSRRDRRAARAVHRHGGRLHDHGAGHRHHRRLQQPRVRRPDRRQQGCRAHLARVQRGDHAGSRTSSRRRCSCSPTRR